MMLSQRSAPVRPAVVAALLATNTASTGCGYGANGVMAKKW